MIEATNLFFSYTGTAPFVLRDLSLLIPDGEYISIVGENGSGKSTLLRILLRFLKPTSGSIRTDATRVGYLPQRTDASDAQFPITVREVLDSYRHLLRLRDRKAVEEALAQVGLLGMEDRLMGTLSGGQAQKVRIARALMGTPELLILDEPSTGVDPDSTAEIYAILNRVNRQTGVTILSVEHNLDAAIANSTQIYHLVNGNGHLCTPQQYADEYFHKGREAGKRC